MEPNLQSALEEQTKILRALSARLAAQEERWRSWESKVAHHSASIHDLEVAVAIVPSAALRPERDAQVAATRECMAVVADDWGGLFGTGDGCIMADNWGGLFEYPAHFQEEQDIYNCIPINDGTRFTEEDDDNHPATLEPLLTVTTTAAEVDSIANTDDVEADSLASASTVGVATSQAAEMQLHVGWARWLEGQADYLRHDRMLCSNLDSLTSSNHPLLQDASATNNSPTQYSTECFSHDIVLLRTISAAPTSEDRALQQRRHECLVTRPEWRRIGGRNYIMLEHHPNRMFDACDRFWHCVFALCDFGSVQGLQRKLERLCLAGSAPDLEVLAVLSSLRARSLSDQRAANHTRTSMRSISTTATPFRLCSAQSGYIASGTSTGTTCSTRSQSWISSKFEHFSIPTPNQKVFNLSSDVLNKRDPWVGTFDHIFTELGQPQSLEAVRLPCHLRHQLPDCSQLEFTDEVFAAQEVFEELSLSSPATWVNIGKLLASLCWKIPWPPPHIQVGLGCGSETLRSIPWLSPTIASTNEERIFIISEDGKVDDVVDRTMDEQIATAVFVPACIEASLNDGMNAGKTREAFADHQYSDYDSRLKDKDQKILFEDEIDLSLFNCKFDSCATDSPVIDVVYTALKEAELRSTDLWPYWKVDCLCKIIPRQLLAEKAMMLIRNTVGKLIMKHKEIQVETEQIVGEDYVNEGDSSILRFLLANVSPKIEEPKIPYTLQAIGGNVIAVYGLFVQLMTNGQFTCFAQYQQIFTQLANCGGSARVLRVDRVFRAEIYNISMPLSDLVCLAAKMKVKEHNLRSFGTFLEINTWKATKTKGLELLEYMGMERLEFIVEQPDMACDSREHSRNCLSVFLCDPGSTKRFSSAWGQAET
jgi:hypothetical protein